jgi:oxygen-dependent protoporphyrinogen oxidase
MADCRWPTAAPRIVIVGAGISGLATAYHLQGLLPRADITILEAGSRPGGTIWTERHDGFQFEVGANGFLDNKRSTLDLCEALGIRGELIPAHDAAKRRFLFHKDRLHLLPEGVASFLCSPLLGWRSKWAILTERFRGPCRTSTQESVYDFIARRTTSEVADVLGDALVTGIFAGDARRLSMSCSFPRICEMALGRSLTAGMKAAARKRQAEAKARGEPYRRSSQLLSFQGGLRRLIERLCETPRRPPQLGVRVRQIARFGEHWRIHADHREPFTADIVILACPAYRQAEMLSNFDGELARCVAEIPYAPVVVLALGFRSEDLRRPADGFGFIVPQRLRRDILGVQWCSAIFPDRAPPGHTLMRVMAGGWHRPDVLEWDDARLLAAVRAELKTVMQVEAPPVFQQIVRWPRAIPQYEIDHPMRIAEIERLAGRHQGLLLTGNAYHGVALNDCTEQALHLAERVAELAGQNADSGEAS